MDTIMLAPRCWLHKVGHEGAPFAAGRGVWLLYIVKEKKVSNELVVEREYGSDIAAAIAVVWRRPDCDKVFLGKVVLVTLHHQLVRSTDEVDAVDVRKFLGGSRAKQVARSARANLPACNVLGIGPHQIAVGALVWDFLDAFKHLDLVHGSEAR